MTDWPAALDEHEHAIEAECVPLDMRICPTCGGGGIVEHQWRDDYGDMTALDTCPDCDGTGEIEVAPIDEEDLP
jgi:DnaJ-class molecular chaperone